MVELPGHGNVEHVEVSSGGRRWAFAGLAFLLLCIVVGVIAFFQRSSTSNDEVEGDSSAEVGSEATAVSEASDAEELAVRYERASNRLDEIIKRATILAAKDDWSAAESVLLKGKRTLDENAHIDTKGELAARFEKAETGLRSARADYKRLLSALAERDYKRVGRHYQNVVSGKGPFVDAAKAALQPEKTRLVSSGDALCTENVLGKCLDYYQKATLLDPTDTALAKKVAEVRTRIVESASN